MAKTDGKWANRKNLSSNISLSPEDLHLWAHVTSDVDPLVGSSKQRGILNARKKTSITVEKRSQKLYSSPSNDENNNKNISLKHGYAPGLDNRTKTRLRRGQVTIESRLDLHGMTQLEAHERLNKFIERAWANGHRTVLVITGKGLRQNGPKGVLRSVVPLWLNQPPLRNWIKAFNYAIPRDGGDGALYVLLRRRK